MASLAQYLPSVETASANFFDSAWPIPIVMLGYFIVIVLDNILVWHGNKTFAKMTSRPRTGNLLDAEMGPQSQPQPQSRPGDERQVTGEGERLDSYDVSTGSGSGNESRSPSPSPQPRPRPESRDVFNEI